MSIVVKVAYCSRVSILYDLHNTKHEEGTYLMSFSQELSQPFLAILTTSEVVVCIYGYGIERFYNEQGHV